MHRATRLAAALAATLVFAGCANISVGKGASAGEWDARASFGPNCEFAGEMTPSPERTAIIDDRAAYAAAYRAAFERKAPVSAARCENHRREKARAAERSAAAHEAARAADRRNAAEWARLSPAERARRERAAAQWQAEENARWQARRVETLEKRVRELEGRH